jgi:hypothetical protein
MRTNTGMTIITITDMSIIMTINLSRATDGRR